MSRSNRKNKRRQPTNVAPNNQHRPSHRGKPPLRRRPRPHRLGHDRRRIDITALRNLEPVKRSKLDADDSPALRFTPDAWAKLLWLRDRGTTEIGGFGITDPDDPLRVIEFVTVRQVCTAASVQFQDEAVAEFFEDQLEAGRRPEQCGRCWIHTHPGHSASPSGLDEQTFARVFGVCDWAVMAIVAKGGESYARLRCNVGPGAAQELPTRVDFTPPFHASNEEVWEAEYQAHVQVAPDEMFDLFEDIEMDPLLGEVAYGTSGARGWINTTLMRR